MIKKLIAVAATSLFSLNASAAYIQYNFSGTLSGYVVQNEQDHSIAYYNFDLALVAPTGPIRLPLTPQMSEGSTRITSATTYFASNGPANLSIYSDFGGDQRTWVSFDFAGATLSNLVYTGSYASSIYTYSGWQNYAGTLGGAVSVGPVNPAIVQVLDYNGGYYDGMNGAVTPTLINLNQVPEPASLALFAIGAIGAAGAVRRRNVA
jgi:hypothetical protein